MARLGLAGVQRQVTDSLGALPRQTEGERSLGRWREVGHCRGEVCKVKKMRGRMWGKAEARPGLLGKRLPERGGGRMKGGRESRIERGEKRDRNGGKKETTSECCLKVDDKNKFLEILCGNWRPLSV